MGKLRSTINLTAQPQPVSDVKPTSVQAPVPPALPAETPTVWEDKPFTYEELKRAWDAFAQLRQENGGTVSEQIMLNREFKIDGTEIELLLDNLHQNILLNEVKPELLGYLRRQLKNHQIQINHRIAPNEVKRNPYTQLEKFNALADKNPSLLELQRLLGLDVDF